MIASFFIGVAVGLGALIIIIEIIEWSDENA
jgi:hypothetical protein